jgi:carbon monoxide dehydrogenase subunit G
LPDVPSQTFTHQARTNASVDEVWEALDQPRTWEAIGGVDRIVDPRIDEKGRLMGFSFETIAAGRRYVGEATPHERVEGETMAWAIRNQEIRGVTKVDLESGEGGTAITVTLQVESAGLLASMFFPVIATAIGHGLPRSVDTFAASLAV